MIAPASATVMSSCMDTGQRVKAAAIPPLSTRSCSSADPRAPADEGYARVGPLVVDVQDGSQESGPTGY